MKKVFLTLAVIVMAICASAQKNQYFWYQGNLMLGNPIAQIDSVTFGNEDDTDSIIVYLPRTIIKTVEVHDTVYITIHDTICPNEDISENGALPGEFSISATKKVHFSSGNLQYNAALGTHQCADGTTQQGTWRFAENQWDFVGDETYGTVYANDVKCSNGQISATYNGWIDLFCWGTSGWNSGAVEYQPYSTSESNSDFFVCGNSENDLVGECAYADWGVYNAISNGGNTTERWRLLTSEEWDYILNTRINADMLSGLGIVSGINGLILLPDTWSETGTISFIPNSYDATANIYSQQEWKMMEDLGAVFLPFTGVRDGLYMHDFESDGYYWTSTQSDSYYAWRLWIQTYSYYTYDFNNRYSGFAVRLVQDVVE